MLLFMAILLLFGPIKWNWDVLQEGISNNDSDPV